MISERVKKLKQEAKDFQRWLQTEEGKRKTEEFTQYQNHVTKETT